MVTTAWRLVSSLAAALALSACHQGDAPAAAAPASAMT